MMNKMSSDLCAFADARAAVAVTCHLQEVNTTEKLKKVATARIIRSVRKESSRDVERELQYYDLDVVIAVDYRVKSKEDISHEEAVRKAEGAYEQFRVRQNIGIKGYCYQLSSEQFRVRQDFEYISEFDREMAKYLRGEDDAGEGE